MSHLKLWTRLRQVCFAAMFGLVAATATASLSHDETAQDTPAPSSFSGYIIAVG